MSSMFASAVENEMISTNPVTRSVKYAKKEKLPRRVFSIAEENKFLDAARLNIHYDEFVFVLETGLRVGELSGLKWSDINWIKRTISITETLYYDRDTHDFVTDAPKTQAGRRTISLTDKAYEVLCNRKLSRSSVPISMKWHAYVFLNKNGKPVDARTYNKCLHNIVDSMGIKEQFTMHCLRHTFATRCIEAGMKPKTLQYILGHSTLSMTMDLYVHTTSDDVAQEMKQFEASRRRLA